MTITLHIIPRASSTAVVGIHGNALKLRIQAPPVDGKANKSLTTFIAGILHCPVRNITLLGGAGCREKTVRIRGVDAEIVKQALRPT
ncbi:MAG TPA: hypothetical protein DCS43_02285 [Verrucomicrobia bacterium]|nr:hypothetical protein [Verrucomicrobiota bacterium]